MMDIYHQVMPKHRCEAADKLATTLFHPSELPALDTPCRGRPEHKECYTADGWGQRPMDTALVLATDDGVVTGTRTPAGWRADGPSLRGRRVTSIIAREGVILAGTTAGVWRSDDVGRTWAEASAGLTTRHVRWLAFHPDVSDREFAGTEPAGIFVSHDGARSWRACPEVAALRDAHLWFLPYSPEAGCVRGFAFHDERVYAAVEVGGVLRSDDAGETWQLAPGSTGVPDFAVPPSPLVHADVHSVVVDPRSRDRVFAATAEGLYSSHDGGRTWTLTHAGAYCRAVWVDPEDAAHLVLGPADGVERNGRIEETRDGGASWTDASSGLEAPWREAVVERFVDVGDELLAITSHGTVYAAPRASLHWQQILRGVGHVNAAAQDPT